MKSKAAVLYQYRTPLVVEEVEVLEPQQGEVLVKVFATGLCYSNYRAIQGHWKNTAPPVILGDEGAGVVEQVGEGVTMVKPGDHIVLSWLPHCRNCYYCNRGISVMCDRVNTVESSRFRKGEMVLNHAWSVSSFSEYTVIPESGAILIKDDVPLDKAVLVGCAVPTGWGAVVNTAGAEAGSSVVIIGCGGVGLSAVMGAVTVGAEKIIAVDIRDNKLEMARQFGATHTINSSREDPVAKVLEITEGRGADYAFDVIGIPEVMEQAFACIRKRGTAVMVGMPPDGTRISINTDLLFGERRVIGSVYGSIQPPVDIPRIIDLYMSGKLKLDQLITKTYPIEKINEGMEALLNGEVARALVKF
ncbi:MAG: Zn-dependent alcohol dehydrogenase [Dehalococcoidia bacterium]